MELTDKEKKLIEKIRKLEYGKLVIFVQNGQPERIESGVKSEKL